VILDLILQLKPFKIQISFELKLVCKLVKDLKIKREFLFPKLFWAESFQPPRFALSFFFPLEAHISAHLGQVKPATAASSKPGIPTRPGARE
jgi:hypothetical protein